MVIIRGYAHRRKMTILDDLERVDNTNCLASSFANSMDMRIDRIWRGSLASYVRSSFQNFLAQVFRLEK